MKVAELIEMLQDMDPEVEVKFVYNYGDHWRTNVAQDINMIEEGEVAYSEYHRMDKVVEPDYEEIYEPEEGEEPAPKKETKSVIFLR